MIVRISTEGQYRLDDAHAEELNELDNAVVAACDRGDEDAFHGAFANLLERVRAGAPLGDDELEGSDVIVPPPDISMQDARAEFSGDGLIPD
jgi:hypothetical protein